VRRDPRVSGFVQPVTQCGRLDDDRRRCGLCSGTLQLQVETSTARFNTALRNMTSYLDDCVDSDIGLSPALNCPRSQKILNLGPRFLLQNKRFTHQRQLTRLGHDCPRPCCWRHRANATAVSSQARNIRRGTTIQPTCLLATRSAKSDTLVAFARAPSAARSSAAA
jgi:hypothetical protein